MMKKILYVMLILAMAITAVGCSNNDRQGGSVAETTKIEDKDTNNDPIDSKSEDPTTEILIMCFYTPPFVSVESSFSRSDIIVRGICRSVDDHSNSRDYLFDVIEVYDGNYTETTISVHESTGGVERPESLYEVGKEYYLPLNRRRNDVIDMSDPTASIYLGDFENVYNLSLPIHEPQEQFVLVYEAQEQLVLRDTPISKYAREETVLALSSPDTAAEYFRTRRFSEINAEQIAEEARPKTDNAN